jgi:hypothetical protein
MWFTVEYLRDPNDPTSQCWELLPLALDLEGARTIARDGFAHANQHLGARGFRILDHTGAVVAEEKLGDGEATHPMATLSALAPTFAAPGFAR